MAINRILNHLVLILALALGAVSLQAQNLLQNGGFEIQTPPVQVNPPTFSIFPSGQLPGWSTTASDQKVEIWSSGYSSSSGGPVYTITQADGFFPNGGNYFTELNANVVSTLYQTVTFTKAGDISYSFWHRGRSGTDTMALQIQMLDNGTWNQIYYQQISTGQTWTQYQGRNVAIVKPGEVLRFNFVSVQGSTSSIGNFLDNAAFGFLAFPPPEPNTPITPETPSTPEDPVVEPDTTDPEINLDATEGLAFQSGVADQLLAQTRQLGSYLYDRFAMLRAERQNPEETAPLVESDAKEVNDPKEVISSGKSFTAPINGNPTTIGSEEHLPWNVWGQGSGILSDVPSVNSIPGQHNAGGAFLVGIDYYLTRNLTVGIYSGYLLNRQNFTGLGGGSAWSDGLAYGGYISYSRPQGGLYADGTIGGGGYQSQVTRPINLYGANYGSASSTPTSTFLTMYGDTGYDLKRANWTMGPIAMFQYTQMNVPSVQESDPYNLNLKANAQELYSLYSGLGGHLSYRIPTSASVTLLPELRCFWNHEFYNASRSVTGGFQAIPGSSFSYTDTLSIPNTVTPSIGITALFGSNISTSLFYSAALGGGSSLQDITLSANLNF